MAARKSAETNRLTGHYERVSERMLQGGALKARSCIKVPSIPQIRMFKYLQSLCPEAILEHGVRVNDKNYSLDVAIPSPKIDFEWDGQYWHRDKNKDCTRDLAMALAGWKVCRLNKEIDWKREIIEVLNYENAIKGSEN